jgi:hypothetical protein
MACVLQMPARGGLPLCSCNLCGHLWWQNTSISNCVGSEATWSSCWNNAWSGWWRAKTYFSFFLLLSLFFILSLKFVMLYQKNKIVLSFFYFKFDPYFLFFFCFRFLFRVDFFLISSFDIKLVRNWISWFFYEVITVSWPWLRVWNTNPNWHQSPFSFFLHRFSFSVSSFNIKFLKNKLRDFLQFYL